MFGDVPLTVVLVACLFFLVGLVIFAMGASWLRRGVLFWRSDPVSVMEASYTDGQIELEATAVPGDETIVAPFTGTECLAHEYRVQTYSSSDNGSSWRTIHSGDERVPFLVEDDTGSVVLDIEDADLSIATDERITVGRGETANDRIASFLDTIDDVDPGSGGSSNIGPVTVKTGDKRRYVEQRIDVGDSVHVFGQVNDRPHEGPVGSVNAAIGDGPKTPVFHVGDRSEASTVTRHVILGSVFALFGLVFMGITVVSFGPLLL